MLKKLFVVLSVVTALGLTIATASTSYAAPDQHNQKNQKKFQAKKNFQPKKNFQNHTVQSKRNNFVVGQKYNGHYWYGRNRHRWHGQWYAYGQGPCWVNVDGLWFWNVAACP